MDNYKKYAEIAQAIGADDLLRDINNIIDSAENKTYLLSFMGQFSAGKSKLINCLLGRDILPVHITETTAAVTYIQYGDEDAVVIKQSNGSTGSIEIEQVRELWQDGKLNDGTDISDVNSISIYLNNNLLKNGLIIADTPGINTNFKRHEMLTLDLLHSTEEIVFVMGKPLTREDTLFIDKIRKNGIPVLFVRTHMDEIKENEESIKSAEEKEKDSLLAYIPEARMFFTSSEPENSYYKNIELLRDYIGRELSDNISERLELSLDSRINKIKRDLEKIINEALENLNQIQEKEHTSYETKMEGIDLKIKAVKKGLDNRIKRIDAGFLEAKEDADDKLNRSVSKLCNKFKKNIDSRDMTVKYNEEIEDYSYKMLNEAYEELKDVYLIPFNKFIEDNNSDIKDSLSFEDFDIPEISMPRNVEDIIDERLENDMLVTELKNDIEDTKRILKEIEDSKKELSFSSDKELKELNENCEEIKNDIDKAEKDLGPYVPKYKTDYSKVKGIGDGFRTVGKLMDWGALILPGAAYEKAAANLGKTFAKAGKVLSSMGKAANTADKWKDITYIFKNISETRKTKKRTQLIMDTTAEVAGKIKQNAPSFWDMLTFEHWLGVLGDKIDGKPVVREDLEYKNKYEREKENIERMIQVRDNKEFAMRERAGLFKTEQEKLDFKAQQRLKFDESVRNSLKAREQEIRKEARKAAYNEFVTKIKNWFDKNVSDMAKEIKEGINGELKNIFDQYKERCTNGVVAELESLKTGYNKLLEDFKGLNESELGRKISEYTDYLKEIV